MIACTQSSVWSSAQFASRSQSSASTSPPWGLRSVAALHNPCPGWAGSWRWYNCPRAPRGGPLRHLLATGGPGQVSERVWSDGSPAKIGGTPLSCNCHPAPFLAGRSDIRLCRRCSTPFRSSAAPQFCQSPPLVPTSGKPSTTKSWRTLLRHLAHPRTCARSPRRRPEPNPLPPPRRWPPRSWSSAEQVAW